MRTGTSEDRKIWQKTFVAATDSGLSRGTGNVTAVLTLGTGDPRVEVMFGLVWKDTRQGNTPPLFNATFNVTPTVRDEQNNAFYQVQPLFPTWQPLPNAIEGATASAQLVLSASLGDVGTANSSYGTYAGSWLVIARVTCGVEVSPAEWASLSGEFDLYVPPPVVID